MNDGVEVNGGSDPLNPCDPDDSLPGCQVDTDGDGVIDAIELVDGTVSTDPCSYLITSITLPISSAADCDGDGLTDAVEIANGSDATDPCDPDSTGIECIDGIYLPTGFSPNGTGNGLNENLTILVGKNVLNFTLYLQPTYKIGGGTAVFGKVGYIHGDVKISGGNTATGSTINAKDTLNGYVVGLGVQHNINKNVFVRLEGSFTAHDDVTATDSLGTKFTADSELIAGKLSIGYSF